MTRRHRNAASGRFAAARDAEADPERHVAERVDPPRPALLPVREERMSGAMTSMGIMKPENSVGQIHHDV